jgi:hypothetical protein
MINSADSRYIVRDNEKVISVVLKQAAPVDSGTLKNVGI